MDGNARGVSEQFAKSYFSLCGELIVGDSPGFEVLVDVGVEIQFSGLHEAQNGNGGDRFADGRCLEESFGSNGRAAELGDAEPASPFDFSVVHYGDADAGHVQRGHAVGQFGCLTGNALTLDENGGNQAVLDAADLLFDRGLRGDLGGCETDCERADKCES